MQVWWFYTNHWFLFNIQLIYLWILDSSHIGFTFCILFAWFSIIIQLYSEFCIKSMCCLQLVSLFSLLVTVLEFVTIAIGGNVLDWFVWILVVDVYCFLVFICWVGQKLKLFNHDFIHHLIIQMDSRIFLVLV
jgi:hypothetical protein